MARRWSVAVLGMSLLLVVNGAAHAVQFDLLAAAPPRLLFELAVLFVPAAIVAYASKLVARRSPELERRVVAWTLFGGVVAVLLTTLALYGGSVRVEPRELLHAVGLVAPLGTAVGLSVGLREAEFVENARNAERARARAASLARERRTLRRLNGVLRHHVLNGANVIVGNAQLLREAPERPDGGETERDERLETIADRAASMATTVDRVRTLIRTTTDDTDPRPLDVVEVLERELQWVEEAWPTATVEADLPEEALAEADELLSEALHELLANALEHGEEPRVGIRVDADERRIEVRVTDDGPGLPTEASLFELSERGDGGLGLYLVRNVVERYGEVSVEETGPEGTTMRVSLSAV